MVTRSPSRGRPVSWISVTIMLGGFLLGGVALTLGQWWLFLTGGGIVVVGGLLAVATDIFSDVMLDPIHQSHADSHLSPIKGVVSAEAPDEVDPSLPGHAPDIVYSEETDR